ncbi:hypothetical protein [Roseofilum casamattae]|uniref:Phycobilisome protein n=1 Tax=Roseofilum casamattae BLCC-M143 TaxID=3022442 RepID=A0ABT7BW86_9CYAN|nr:hypothetical protein [Roseofilum casamattae]MDJ1183463.1 hypothetical protein [Roseofilum casamattae BLCC-M143]
MSSRLCDRRSGNLGKDGGNPMHPELETLLAEAENRYLKTEELKVLTQYVESLPQRMETYRCLRDNEVEILQAVADRVPGILPDVPVEQIERSLKNMMLMLRYCSMSMLINDDSLVKERFIDWISETMRMYDSAELDKVLYKLLNQQLMKSLSSDQIKLIKRPLILAQTQLLSNQSS